MLTRRAFLGQALGSAAAMAAPLGPWNALTPYFETRVGGGFAILDPGAECSLREAVAGYGVALDSRGPAKAHVGAWSVPDCALLIIPAALGLAPSVARLVMRRLRDGRTVILESGAAFAPDDGPLLHDHRDFIREQLGIHTMPPVALWPRAGCGIPYVDFTWPSPALVRDFSRVVPIDERRTDGEIIARVDGMAVAVRAHVGAGTLIFLGSPLGPALMSGEPEARRWLGSIVERSRAHMAAHEVGQREIRAAGTRRAPGA